MLYFFNKMLVSRLLANNYKVYIPIHSDNTIIISNNNKIELCFALSAYKTKNKKYVKLTFQKDGEQVFLPNDIPYTLLIVDMEEQKIWRIPSVDLPKVQYLSLQKRWDNYLLEPVTIIENNITVKSVKEKEAKQERVNVILDKIRTKRVEKDESKQITDIFNS